MFVVGIDIGQQVDPTAIVVIESVRAPAGQYAYHVRHIERLPLGTRYPAIVDRVQALRQTPPLTLVTPVVLDRTGVGAPVTDMFGDDEAVSAITITGGDTVVRESWRHTKVPKRDLVATLVALFHSGRLLIAAGLPEREALLRELLAFRVKVSIEGHDSYEAWRERDHDDIVLALALATWHAAHPAPVWGAV
jgi:hypothetical protein